MIAIQVNANVEIIDDFVVTIDIMKDSSLFVTEEISYDFGLGQKYGIFRDIPYKYKVRGGNFSLRLSKISVSNEFGEEYDFSVNKKGNYKSIKVGDADTFVSGKKKYIIKYKINRALNFFADYDELYWNVTGNEWTIPIKQSRAVVNFPVSLNEDKIKAQCFSGKSGSTNSCISHRYQYKSKDMVESVSFVDDKLLAGEGLTIVLGLAKNVVKEPHIVVRIFQIIKDNYILGLPIAIFMVMLFLWYKKGKDPMGRGVIIYQTKAPKNLTPAEVGTIIDEKVHKKDISADVINLAVKGYIKISKIKKDGYIFKSSDFLLTKLKEFDDSLALHEKNLLESLFKEEYLKESLKKIKKKISKKSEHSLNDKTLNFINNLFDFKEDYNEQEFSASKKTVSLSQLRDKYYKDLESVKKQVYISTVEKGLFTKNPTKVRGFYTSIGVIFLVLGWFAGPLFDFVGILGFIVSGIIFIIFAFFMPQKTKKGVLAREHILGLKTYIETAEKDRIDFHNAPEKNPEHFEKLLPFAIVLGVEKKWAKQFRDIYSGNPNWYSDSSHDQFSAINLSSSLRSFDRRVSSVLSSNPNTSSSSASSRSSGFSGGRSGGGFGGGGGQSW